MIGWVFFGDEINQLLGHVGGIHSPQRAFFRKPWEWAGIVFRIFNSFRRKFWVEQVRHYNSHQPEKMFFGIGIAILFHPFEKFWETVILLAPKNHPDIFSQWVCNSFYKKGLRPI